MRESGLFCDEELDVDSIISNEDGVDMLHPYQTRIGARAGDSALGEGVLVDLSDEIDDEDE